MKLVAILAIAVGTCAFAPPDLRDFEPPEHYREVFREAVACTGRYRPYERIRWSELPGKSFKCSSGMCIGHWQSPDHITIAHEWRGIDWVVRHEIIHFLYQRGHWDGDWEVFGKACKATWGWLGDDPNYKP